ncbi:MAG: sensor histidine kinase [Saprospiraceae bacterium]
MFDSKGRLLVKLIVSHLEESYFCSMIDFIKNNYSIFIKGFLVNLVLLILFSKIGIIRIEPTAVMENVFIFTFWWMFFSFLIFKIPYFKANKDVVAKMLGLLGILIMAITVDIYLQIPNNPITIPLIIFFWLGVAYLVLPKFFKKYQVTIFSVYGVSLSYFLFFRRYSDYGENYHEIVINLLLIPIPVFFGLWIFEQWRWLKTLQAEKGKAELALLKSQINPHFFFNTLNNLYGLTVEKSDQAPEVVLKLADMMRYTIYKGKEDFVSIKDEVKYLENYIELHKIRFQKKVKIDFTKQINEDVKVAPLLFIILLENAFKHGVEKMTEDAYIHLDLKADASKINFAIENNFEETKSKKEKGIGLDNLKKRLEYMYPKNHKLAIDKHPKIYRASLNIKLS